MHRALVRSCLVVFLALALFAAPLPPVAPALAADPAAVKLVLQPFVGGFNAPVYATHAGDRSQRLFVVEQFGRIKIVKNGAKLGTSFLDISGLVLCESNGCGERGLLSVAFHPNYATNGYFYVNYTRRDPDPDPGNGINENGDLVLARYRVSATNPDVADPASATILLTIPHNVPNHNGGTVAFGPDGYLYWSTGDGGGGGDSLNNGQRLVTPINPTPMECTDLTPPFRNCNALLGKILRLDVNGPPAPGKNYAIPPTNPFAGATTGEDEIWAYGLRNPWRMAFDPPSGLLFTADVGQGLYEEVNAVPANAAGVNYGWRFREGAHCYNPGTGCPTTGLTDPVAEYRHGTGDCSVTGGFVYRGSRYPQLSGLYLYGDFCTARVWSLDQPSPGNWRNVLLADTMFDFSLVSFGQGEDRELYFVAGGATGSLYRITALALSSMSASSGSNSGGQPVTLAGTGFTTGAVVRFGDAQATVVAATDSSLTVTVPGRLPPGGPVDVSVSLGGQTVTLPGAFTYIAPNVAPPMRGVGPAGGAANPGMPPRPGAAPPLPNTPAPLPAPSRR